MCTVDGVPRRRFKVICGLLAVSALISFSPPVAVAQEQVAPGGKSARYVFLFIGDGMGLAQRTAAEIYLATGGGAVEVRGGRLAMSTLPVHGLCSTYPVGGLVTDSAAAGTALACGFKTANGRICMDAGGRKAFKSIAELARDAGMKIGIVSSVSLDHATPACFYAHQPSRGMYYQIALELTRSDFDYFAGGGLKQPKGPDGTSPDAFELAKRNGFTLVSTRGQFNALKPGVGKIYAFNHTLDDKQALFYELDRPADQISLAEFTAKGIELLDGPEGFFMMVEGGKIDWACHANDAATMIHEVLAFDEAIQEALAFYRQHPQETLIVVTADHECGGLTAGLAGVGNATMAEKIDAQKMSYFQFDKLLASLKRKPAYMVQFETILPVIRENFGLALLDRQQRTYLEQRAAAGDRGARLTLALALNEYEIRTLREALAVSMGIRCAPAGNDHLARLYRSYDPLRVQLTRMLAEKAGVVFTSGAHTATPVPVMAIGVGQEQFGGYCDNAELGRKIMAVMGFSPQVVTGPRAAQADPAAETAVQWKIYLLKLTALRCHCRQGGPRSKRRQAVRQ